MLLYMRLAWRNLWRHRRRTVIIVLAMGLSLSMMMLYDGMIDGFNQAIYGNAIRVLGGNIQIHAAGYGENIASNPLLPLADAQAVVQTALKDPQVVAAAPRIQTGGLATDREGAFPVSIIGIDPPAEAPLSIVAENIQAGRFLAPDDGDSILIGHGLADAMGVQLGDRLTLVGSDLHKQNRQRTMTVVGIYDLGLPDTEKRTVYISLSEAQNLYGLPGQATEVVVNLKKLGLEDQVIGAIAPALPGYEVESWSQNYPELQATIGSKNLVMNIFSVIIIVIAAVGILNLLLMAVYERTREIGLLGALGLKPGQISLLFILEGTFMGLVGVAAGIALGLLINGLLRRVGLDFSAYSNITSYMALLGGKVYPSLGVEKLLSRGLTVAIISALAALYPAYEAAHREPAEALHFV
jgi:ABC-type lipoprotein release transport system permease subunit